MKRRMNEYAYDTNLCSITLLALKQRSLASLNVFKNIQYGNLRHYDVFNIMERVQNSNSSDTN